MATPKQSAADKKGKTGTQPASRFPIVGIGASAGGLEAFEAFFKAMPEKSGMAYVMVAHLDPSHTSILPEIIQKKTRMKVCQITDNMMVEPDHVYIIPPNKELAIFKGVLHLLEMRKPRGSHLPIDAFFRSLAQDRGNTAISIVLSGTGTDGTLGIRAIKGEAGMVMAQDPDSAKYDGMPKSAIATGMVDYTLPPAEMAGRLLDYIYRQKTHRIAEPGGEDEKTSGALQKIFVLLRAATDHDFSLYKKNTLNRRIERRMHIHQIDDIGDYVRYLQESEREVSILFKELLIGVTSFFRDPDAYELLKNIYLPELLHGKPDEYQIRVWVPGCSSGEEAYSLAIIFHECMEIMGRRFPVQIFATDLDEQAINTARPGIYPESIGADVSQERLRKFFMRDDNCYQIKKNIREMVVFAPQNIIKDPPFTKLDMLCCRNLLIYFGSELQKKLFPVFHYSLKQGGILFLGSSETIGQATDLFVIRDKKWKIFICHSAKSAERPVLDFPTSGPVTAMVEKEPPKPLAALKDVSTIKLLKAVISQSDMPTCVVIDDMANILYIHGRTGRYLEPAEGEASINIIKMARPGLQAGLTNAISKLAAERKEVTIKGLQLTENGGRHKIHLTVKPLPDFQTGHRGMMLVIFEEAAHRQEKAAPAAKSAPAKKSAAIKRLEDELLYTRENLQTTIEELETSNEELKSTNEELQSTNEELQSTNEELQSLNEESSTVNSELQSRIDELVAANDDIKNLLDATEIATIFLDIDLNIRRYTPRVTDFIYLTSADIGRPIEHFATTLSGIHLRDCAKKVLQDLGQYEANVEDDKARKYRMRMRPYRTLNNVIDGVVVTFEDITEYSKVVEALTETEEKWRGLVENAPMAIFIQTNSRFSYLNPAAILLFGSPSPDTMQNQPVLDYVHQEYHASVSKQFETVKKQKKPAPAFDQKWLRGNGDVVELVVSAAPVVYNGELSALVFARKKL